MGAESLVVNLSGGAANADPTLSTGGVKSSVIVLSQAASLSGAIPGVTITDAAGNTPGVGTLSYLFASKTLSWKPFGAATAGTAININANGTYLIRGPNTTDGYVIVTVVSASLSITANYAPTATVTNQSTLFLPAVSKDTALAGATEYFLYYLTNSGATTIKAVQVQVQTDTPGADTLSVAVISAKNTTEAQGAAAGHTYSVIGVDVAMGDLLTTDYWGFWIRRVTPAATINGVVANTFRMRVTSLT